MLGPWRDDLSHFNITNGIGNGGLSLRRKSYMLYIIENYNKECDMNEDVVIGMMCKNLNLPMPTYQEASNFSVETVMNNDPVGLHSPHFSEDQIKHLLL